MSSPVTGLKSAERSLGQVDTTSSPRSVPSAQGQNRLSSQETVTDEDDDEVWPDYPPGDTDMRGKRDRATAGVGQIKRGSTKTATPSSSGSVLSAQGQNKPESQETVPGEDDDEEWPDDPPDDSNMRGKREKPTIGVKVITKR